MNSPSLLPAESASVLTLNDFAAQDSASITSRTLLQTPDFRVLHFTFSEGQELTRHTSSRRALVQILSGDCEFFFNNAWHTLSEGSVLHMPPGHPHAVRAATGPFTMLLTLGVEAASPSSV